MNIQQIKDDLERAKTVFELYCMSDEGIFLVIMRISRR